MMSLHIETERLRLVAQTKDNTRAAIKDRNLFGQLLGAYIPKEWPHEMMADAEPYFADMLSQDPDSIGWWGWYVILKSQAPAEDILIGGAGFLGRPSPEGTIVMGYSILTQYEGKGYATETAQSLINWAFNHKEVTCVAAETFPSLPLSIRVLEKCGLIYVGVGSEDGTIRYERRKTGSVVSATDLSRTFVGIEYTAANQIQNESLNTKRADLQYEVLENEKKWISDSRADELLNSQK